MKFQQQIISENGAILYLPPNPIMKDLPEPNMYEGTVKQLFPTGTIGFLGQRKFAYAHCTGALAGWARLVIDSNYSPGISGHQDEDGWEGGTYAAAVAGDKVVDIADTTARVKNYYEGGLFNCFHVDGVMSTTIRIAASDVGNGTTHVRLYLDDGLPFALAAGETGGWCDAYRNPYSNVTEHDPADNGFETFVGLSLVEVTAGHWSWLQIGGSCWISQQGNNIPGYTIYNRDAWAHIDGTCTCVPTTLYAEDQLQYIGYVLGMHEASGGDTHIMLRLG